MWTGLLEPRQTVLPLRSGSGNGRAKNNRPDCRISPAAEKLGGDGPLNGPGGLGTACWMTGDSRPFAGDQFSGDIRLSDTLRPIRRDQRIRRKAARAI